MDITCTILLLTAESVELNESVEYKSLPSGLHNVEEDLMYESLRHIRDML